MDEENEVFMFSFYLHVADYKYDEDNETLTVSYDNGAIVQYTEVPKHMAQAARLPSVNMDKYVYDTFHGWDVNKTPSAKANIPQYIVVC